MKLIKNLERTVFKCPKCESYHCVKNGHNSEGKQKYLCKNCRASFDAFRNHFIY
ncbi:IS1/IS1595 family N-terminal zinc-binding domain-containing protein [Spiroplasma endosymbiont of Clivina fossor]